jgi:hypothetical protein
MDVFIIRSPELSKTRFDYTLNLLQKFPGMLQFETKDFEDDFEDDLEDDKEDDKEDLQVSADYPTLTEEELLNKCNEFRDQQDIGDSATVVLLTDLRNTMNNFNGIEFGNKKNIFVQTSDWEKYFVGSDERYPVAYHVVVSILVQNWFKSKEDAIGHLHKVPKGCVMDYCLKKSEVGLKLRTADICSTTLSSLQEYQVSPLLIIHTLAIIEEIRKNMLVKTRWSLEAKPFMMTVRGDNKDIYFKDFGDLQINLNPQQKAFYIFFLNTNQEIYPYNLVNHVDEITKIYSKLDRNGEDIGTAKYENLKKRIENTCNNNKSYDAIFSKIKTAFENALGTELAKHYYIQGERKNISLDRKYVNEEKNNPIILKKI